MRKSFTAMFLALAPVAALTTLAPTAPAYAQQAAVSVSLFYEQLSPHGKWVEHPRWGWVWYPVAVEADWRPYTKGRWVWTDEYGWMWVSHEPFGWATYHYGRWGYDERYGWVWVPGQTWGPAWVAFRYGDRHIGWAPLPPDTLHAGASIRVNEAILTASYYQPRWVFVETRHFVAPQVVTYVVPPARNVTYIHETRNVTNIRVQNNIVINRSIEPERLRTLVRTEIPRVRVQEVQDARRIDTRQRNQTTIDSIQVFKKDVTITREARPPERARAKESDRPKVRVQEQAVRPEDRRGATPATPAQPPKAAPGAPPSRGHDDDRRGATPAKPATPPSRGQPDEKRGATPATPAQPPKAAPGAPPSRGHDDDKRGATPAKPATPPSRGQPDEKRGATPANPAQPPKAAPGAPPSRGRDEDKRGAMPAQPPHATPPQGKPDTKRGAMPAQPAQPPKVAPGAPPSRQSPPQHGQPQHGQPGKPAAPNKGPDKDDKDRGPSR